MSPPLPDFGNAGHAERMTAAASRSMVVPLSAFAAGAVVSLLLGVLGTVHEPTLDELVTLGFGSMVTMKVYLALAVGVLAVLQVVGALWLYGKLPMSTPSWLGNAHRASGVLAVLLSLPVAYACLWAIGPQVGQGSPTRIVVHSVAGCAVYGALVVKVVAVRSRRAPGWMLPIAGGLLFATLLVVVWTSAVWFIGESGWPSPTQG